MRVITNLNDEGMIIKTPKSRKQISRVTNKKNGAKTRLGNGQRNGRDENAERATNNKTGNKTGGK